MELVVWPRVDKQRTVEFVPSPLETMLMTRTPHTELGHTLSSVLNNGFWPLGSHPREAGNGTVPDLSSVKGK